MNKKNILTIIVIFGIGLFLGRFVLVDSGAIYEEAYKKGYNQAWETAKNLVEQEARGLETPKEVYKLTGGINKVSANFLEIEASPVSENPLSEFYKTTVRKVLIDSNTKIIKREKRKREEIEKEEESGKEVSNFWEEIEIPLSGLKKGDEVIVFSDTNILTTKEFTASKIILQLSN